MKIGEIFVVLGLSTASFTTNLDKAKNLAFSNAKEMERSLKIVGTAALSMFSSLGSATAAVVNKTTEMQVHILHLAESAGTSVETMSGLAFASKMLGLDVDQAALAMERFDKKLQLAQQGNAAAGDIMKALGIDPAKIKMSDDALMTIADRFAGMKNGAEKTGEAMNAFGKAGAIMIPILNEGSAGLRKMFDTARALGLIFSKDDADAAEHFQQNLTILHGAMLGWEITLEKAVLPNLNALTDALTSSAKETAGAGTGIDALKFSFQGIASSLVLVVDSAKTFGNEVLTDTAVGRLGFESLYDAIRGVGDALIGDTAAANTWFRKMTENASAAIQAQVDGAARQNSITAETAARLNAIWGEGAKAGTNYQKTLNDIAAASAVHQKAVESLQKSMEGLISKEQLGIATLGMSAEQVQEFKIRTEAAKLGIGGWADAELVLYRQLSSKLTIMQQIAALEGPAREDQKRRFLADQLQSDRDDLAVMLQQLDVSTKLDLSKFSPTAPDIAGLSHTTPTFADSLAQQTAELQDQIATFGMTAQAAAIYHLRQLDISDEARKQILYFQALQGQYNGLQGAALKMERNATAFKSFSEAAYRSFDDLIFSGKAFTQVLADITKQLGEMFLKWALFGFGQNAGGGGGLLGSIFGGLFGLFGGAPMASFSDLGNMGMLSSLGGFASGGTVYGGGPFLVGERGPELFLPGPGASGGTIIPNGGFGGGGVSIVQNFDNRGADFGTVAKMQMVGNKIALEQYHRMVVDRQERIA